MSQSQYDMYEPVSTKKKKNQFNLFIEQIAVELNFGTHQVDSARLKFKSPTAYAWLLWRKSSSSMTK
jgi:hypothetical protein